MRVPVQALRGAAWRGEVVHRGLHAALRPGGTPAASVPSRRRPASRISVRSLKSPRWPMRNIRPLTLPRPVPSDMSKRSVDQLAQRVRVDALGHDHAGQHGRYTAGSAHWIARPHARTARAHAGGPALVAREHVRRPSSSSMSSASAQAVQQVGVGRVGPVAVGVHRDDLVPGPVRARQLRAASRPRAPRGDSALKLMPGGSIRPFCEPPTVTSTPHSSWR